MKMPDRRLYDTRFFVEYFYSNDPDFVRKLKEELKSIKERMVSSLSNTIRGDFEVIDVDYKIAIKSAELRNKHQIPMADSVIAATAQIQQCPLFSDDTHFKNIENLKTAWCKIY
jgi:PIN domain nuclease of toxin-antitoxin system